MDIEVGCYSGYRGEETPRWIRLGSQTVAVSEVIDRWIAPDHRYFKFLGKDGALYIIRYDESASIWELIFYSRQDQTPPAPQPC